MAGGTDGGGRRFPGTLLLAQDLGLSPTGKRRFSVAGEVVDIPVAALGDAVVGDYPDLLRERRRHLDLWQWCLRAEVRPPVEFSPSAG
ncbi:MAG: hypothetical protein HUU06_06680 [Planctomycetaceae bacterium]|nr:hypothetical protein [Planctomycetota bacterium]NUN52456.1 hypothetical protein [Planctomycetaceae bacterium]